MLVLFILVKIESAEHKKKIDRVSEESGLSVENIAKALIDYQNQIDSLTKIINANAVAHRNQIDSLTKTKNATKEQLAAINQIRAAIENLDTNYFKYDNENRRFTIRRQVQFNINEANLKNPDDEKYIAHIGRVIQRLTDTLGSTYSAQNVKYVVIVEGMSSRDRWGTDETNFPLSYRRAWQVKRIWDRNGVRFDPSFVDVQIAGSGTDGIGRNRFNEAANQRILIHIIPKIDEIK